MGAAEKPGRAQVQAGRGRISKAKLTQTVPNLLKIGLGKPPCPADSRPFLSASIGVMASAKSSCAELSRGRGHRAEGEWVGQGGIANVCTGALKQLREDALPGRPHAYRWREAVRPDLPEGRGRGPMGADGGPRPEGPPPVLPPALAELCT